MISSGIASKFRSLDNDHLRAATSLCFVPCWRQETKARNWHQRQSHIYTHRSLVPVIVVFTKLDRLQFREQKRLKKLYIDQGMDPKSAQAKAKLDCVAAAKKEYETSCVAILQSKFVPAAWARFCPVSNKRNAALRNLRHMLMFLPFVRARLHNKLNRTHQVHSPAIGVFEHSLGVSANGSAIHRLDVILFLIQCIRPILISKLKCRWSK